MKIIQKIFAASLLFCAVHTTQTTHVEDGPKQDMKPGLYALDKGKFEKLPHNQSFSADNYGEVKREYPEPNHILWWLNDLTTFGAAATGVYGVYMGLTGKNCFSYITASVGSLALDILLAECMTEGTSVKQRNKYQKEVGVCLGIGSVTGLIAAYRSGSQ